MVLHTANSLKQQFVGEQVIPLGHIIMIPIPPVWSFSSMKLSGENTNFIVFGLTQQVLESTNYRTWREYAKHDTVDDIKNSTKS